MKKTRGNMPPEIVEAVNNPRVTRSSDRVKARKPRGGVPDHVRRGTLSPMQKGKLKAAFRRAMAEH